MICLHKGYPFLSHASVMLGVVGARPQCGRSDIGRFVSVEQFLQIAGAVAAVELLLRGWGEWKAARRIVSIAGLNGDLVVEHSCVPTEFAGSKYRTVRVLVGILGFLFVTPDTRKQAFLVREASGIRNGRWIDYREIRAADSLRITLEGIERPDTFVKSLARGSGGYRTLAIRRLEDSGGDQHAYCVTVRARGMYAPTSDAGTKPQWFEYDVLAAAPRSGFRQGKTALVDLPADAMQLVLTPATNYRRWAEIPTGAEPIGNFRRRMLRHNVNAWVAFAHVASRSGIVFLSLLAPGSASLGWSATWALIRAVVVVIAFTGFLACCLYVLRKVLQATSPEPEPFSATEFESLPTQLVNTRPPRFWTGATSRCMSVGRVVNGTDAKSIVQHRWRRFAYLFKGIRRVYVRFNERQV